MDNVTIIGDSRIGKGCLRAYFDYFTENLKNQGGVVLVSPRTMSIFGRSTGCSDALPNECVLKIFKMPKRVIDKKIHFYKKRKLYLRHSYA
jgi:hypothetical protein